MMKPTLPKVLSRTTTARQLPVMVAISVTFDPASWAPSSSSLPCWPPEGRSSRDSCSRLNSLSKAPRARPSLVESPWPAANDLGIIIADSASMRCWLNLLIDAHLVMRKLVFHANECSLSYRGRWREMKYTFVYHKCYMLVKLHFLNT